MKSKVILASLLVPFLFSGCTVEGTLFIGGDDAVIVEFSSIDSEDGFIDASSIILYSGILVEDDFSTGFLSFPIHPVPHHAVISSAFLGIGVHSVFTAGDSLLIDMFVEPGGYAGTFEVFVPDENNYIFFDVTHFLINALEDNRDTFQVSLEAIGGGVFLEDGGNNLGTGLIPFIEITYF
jgi:hypothetical protein